MILVRFEGRGNHTSVVKERSQNLKESELRESDKGFLSKLSWLVDRLFNKAIPEKRIFVLLIIVIVCILLPMIVVAFFNFPCADDFTYGLWTHQAWESTHSILKTLNAAWERTRASWMGWQGSYSAIFLFSLQPGIFSENLYFLTTFIMLGSLFTGIAYFCDVLFHHCAGGSHIQVGIICLLLIASLTQLLPSPVEAFYWYNGSMYYTFFFGVSLVFYGKLILFSKLYEEKLLSKRQICTRVFSLTLFSVFLGGANYVTALTTAILLASFFVLLLIGKKKTTIPLLIPIVCFFAGFAVNVLAPGNAVRQQYFTRMSPIRAIFLSFVSAGQSIQNWTTLVLVAIIAFCIPVLYRIAANSKFSFRYPFAVPVVSFCLFASMFTPTLYSQGGNAPARLVNIVFFAYVILAFLNVFYLLGSLARLLERNGVHLREYSVGLVLSIAILFFPACSFTQHTYTSSSALASLVYGGASEYHAAYLERYAIYTDDSVKDVVVSEFKVKPYVLFFSDVQSDPSDWRNTSVAAFYGKSSVTLESTE